jgi:predicted nucleic acid-binding protein
VTTASASERFVVDSSGWVEYLGDGPKAESFAKYLDKPEFVLLPTIVVYEVYKKLRREGTTRLAQDFLSGAFGFHERIIDVDVSMAEFAARISIECKLAMADAMIYAAARTCRATLVTGDCHFSGLDSVLLI